MQVRLPGGLLVQAAFHPQEPVENVLTLVLSCLEEGVSDVSLRPYLFTTPPRNVLNMQASLAEAGLVPAATAILAWHAPLPAPLASLAGEALLRPFALALLSVAACTGTDAPVPVAAFPTAHCQGGRGGGEGGIECGARHGARERHRQAPPQRRERRLRRERSRRVERHLRGRYGRRGWCVLLKRGGSQDR